MMHLLALIAWFMNDILCHTLQAQRCHHPFMFITDLVGSIL
jgi:hypothetical protein